MRRRTFGDSGLASSVIGYGGWPMGRGQYGDFDDDEAIGAARKSYDSGIRPIRHRGGLRLGLRRETDGQGNRTVP